MDTKKIAYIILGITIIALFAYAFLPSQKLASGYGVTLQLTDPPQVPNGTHSLNITYSSVQLHVLGGGWVSSNASGTVDLLGILNLTKTLGRVVVPKNSTIDLLRFSITNASIRVNNSPYPVVVPNRQILVHLKGAVNSASTLLTDLSPTVVVIITNSSVPIFLLAPSVRAVIVAGTNKSAEAVGSISRINITAERELDELRPNITIKSAALSTINNVTNISITVKNNANMSVVLRHVLVFGNESMAVNFSELEENEGAHLNGSFALNRSSLEGISNMFEEHHGQISANDLHSIFRNETHNSSAIASLHLNQSTVFRIVNETEERDHAEIEHEHFRVMNFLIGKNSTLLLPRSEEELMEEYEGGGYNLSAGQSVTLKFKGRMSLADRHIALSFKHGQIYNLKVIGEEDARARINVTAT